jgi:hypothetical protein
VLTSVLRLNLLTVLAASGSFHSDRVRSFASCYKRCVTFSALRYATVGKRFAGCTSLNGTHSQIKHTVGLLSRTSFCRREQILDLTMMAGRTCHVPLDHDLEAKHSKQQISSDINRGGSSCVCVSSGDTNSELRMSLHVINLTSFNGFVTLVFIRRVFIKKQRMDFCVCVYVCVFVCVSACFWFSHYANPKRNTTSFTKRNIICNNKLMSSVL